MKYQHHLLHIHIFMLYFVICTYISLVRKKVASCINFLIDSIKYYLHFKIFSSVFVIAYCIKLKQIWYHNNQAKWQKMRIYLLWNQTLRLSQILHTYNTFESCPKKIGFKHSHFIIRIIMESTKFCLGRKATRKCGVLLSKYSKINFLNWLLL